MRTRQNDGAGNEVHGEKTPQSDRLGRSEDLLDDEESLIDDSRDDLDELLDDDDASPGDRRRDPLRRPV